MSNLPQFIDSLPAYMGDIYHEDLRCVELAHVVDVDGLNDITGQTAGVKLFDTTGEPVSLAIYPKDRQPYKYQQYKGVAVMYGNLNDPIHAVLGLDNATALYNALQGTSKGGAVVSLPLSFEALFGGVLEAFKPQCVYTTHDKPIDYVHGDVVSHFAPLSVVLANESLAEMMVSDDVKITKAVIWGELAPLSQKNATANPYPVHAFGELASVVTAIADNVQTPPSMAGQCVLGVLSTIGQGFVNAPFGGEHKPASLFLLTQAPSGAGKTQANRLAYKAVHEYDKAIYQEFKALMDEYQNAKETKSGKERAEYLAMNHEPINATLTVKDATIERILDRFILDEIFSQSWATDEAGQFFGGHSMKADTNANALSSLTSLWSSGEAQRMRSTRGKGATYKTNAYDCRFTLDLSGQAVILESAINDPLLTGQGLLARCLFSAEASLIGDRDWITERTPHENPHLIAFWKRCRAFLDKGVSYYPNGTPKRLNLPFGKGARQTLSRYQQRIEYEQAKGGRLANHTAFASRMAENASRMATLFAWFDGCERVEVEYLEQAFLLTDYSMNAWLNYGEQSSDEPSDIEKLLGWLVKKCHERSVTALNWSFIYNEAPKPIRKNKKYIQELLEVLECSNHIRLDTEGRAKIICLNPQLLA